MTWSAGLESRAENRALTLALYIISRQGHSIYECVPWIIYMYFENFSRIRCHASTDRGSGEGYPGIFKVPFYARAGRSRASRRNLLRGGRLSRVRHFCRTSDEP